MKIKYVHASAPEEEKVHDTVKSLRGGLGVIHVFGDEKSQKDWDAEELARFERDLQKGLVLSYEVIEEDVASMSFDELNRHFQANRPKGKPVLSHHWFEAIWQKNDSVNDALRHWLKEWKIPYLNTVKGEVWFWYEGYWTTCSHNIYLAVKDGDQDKIHFSLNEYASYN